nr:hypothetical protein [Morchella crassipes]
MCSQKAGSHSNEESQNMTHAQESKSDNTKLEENKPKSNNKNGDTLQPSDLSASTGGPRKRGRSSHSSPDQKNPNPKVTKGNSKGSSVDKQGSRNKVNSPNLRTFVIDQLTGFKTPDDKYNGIIRILANPGFLQTCYMLIKGKPGNMSRGITKETLDGIEYEWFENTGAKILNGSFNFTPARKVLIPKPFPPHHYVVGGDARGGRVLGKKEKRPLGVGVPREKIVQKGLQVILEAIYEPEYLDCSHGFRPNRSSPSALKHIYLKGHHHTWVIQGDISKCFDRIPHNVIMKLLKEKIKDERFLTIVNKSLKVGPLDPITKRVVRSDIGTPQGSVRSPLLANIVLHEFDKYMINTILPDNTKGKRRKTNPLYNALAEVRDPRKKYYWEATPEERKKALEMMRTLPRMDPYDNDVRRTMYIRYADDYVILFEGPKSETADIKEKIKTFLYEECGLELNTEKTVITHMTKSEGVRAARLIAAPSFPHPHSGTLCGWDSGGGGGFNFLGAKIRTLANNDYRMKNKTVAGAPIPMRAHVRIRVNMPTVELLEKLIKAGIAKRDKLCNIVAKPYTTMVNADHATIIQFYNAKINGIINYYTFAANFTPPSNRSSTFFSLSLRKRKKNRVEDGWRGGRVKGLNLIWILARLSLAKTLARKYKLNSAKAAFKRFGPLLEDPKTGLRLLAPKSLPTVHQYNIKVNLTPTEKILQQTWYSRLTKTKRRPPAPLEKEPPLSRTALGLPPPEGPTHGFCFLYYFYSPPPPLRLSRFHHIYMSIYIMKLFSFISRLPAQRGGGEGGRGPLRASPSLPPPPQFLNFFYSEKTCLF